MKKRFNLATVFGLVLLTAALTFTLTRISVEQDYDNRLATEKAISARFMKLNNVLTTIEKEFVGEYDYDTLMDYAAAGMISGTGDRWSFYMSADDYKSYMQSVTNTFVGIGATVVYDEERDGILLVKVHPGSPADNAGLAKLDLVITVDGESVADLGYTAAVDKVRGISGTVVSLEVISNGEETSHFVSATRSNYLYNPISSEIINGNIGLIRIENFDERVAANFNVALDNLLKAGVEGLIFDVRNNGGGLKDEMVQMLDKLCPEGVLFTMRDVKGNESVDYSDASEIELPMIVLVNQDSYSAAEFFAVALQEYGKAIVIGTGTSGKGYSQQTRKLGDGSAMNISVNEYFTPNGNSLIGVGVIPDIELELVIEKNFYLLTTEEDTQLMRALEVMDARIRAGE